MAIHTTNIKGVLAVGIVGRSVTNNTGLRFGQGLTGRLFEKFNPQ